MQQSPSDFGIADDPQPSPEENNKIIQVLCHDYMNDFMDLELHTGNNIINQVGGPYWESCTVP